MFSVLTTGAILGLSAGIAPGPLLALVISETLRHDVKAGVKVALAPIITDIPIIILSLLLSAGLSGFHGILGGISFAGAAFILYLGINSLRGKGADIATDSPPAATSFRKGILVNALSPYPYIFWFTVGATFMTRAMQHAYGVAGFIISFYTLLVGSKVIIAVLTAKSKTLMTGKVYIFTLRALGFILCILAGILFRDGLRYLGIL